MEDNRLKEITKDSRGKLINIKYNLIENPHQSKVLVFDNTEYNLKNIRYIDLFKSLKNCCIYLEIKKQYPEIDDINILLTDYNESEYEDLCINNPIFKIIISTTILSDIEEFFAYLESNKNQTNISLSDYNKYY